MADTVIFFIVLLALSALFSGIEIAFFSLSSGGVRTMVRNNLHGAKLVERLKQKPRKLPKNLLDPEMKFLVMVIGFLTSFMLLGIYSGNFKSAL